MFCPTLCLYASTVHLPGGGGGGLPKLRDSTLIYRRFTRRADRRLPPGCYGNLIVNVKCVQSRPKRACGVDPDRHDWAMFTFTIIVEVRLCCTEMMKES